MTPFIGQIQPFGFNFAPRGWAFCDGQLLPIAQNTALFSLIGTTFGGDGRTTFALPDLKGRAMRGVGRGPGLNDVRWGAKAGTDNIVLSTANLPSHNHLVQGTTEDATLDEPSNAVTFGTGQVIYSTETINLVSLRNTAVSNTGGGQSFNSVNPYLGIYVSIALQGVFPSRS